MIDAAKVEAIKSGVDLIAVAEGYTKLRKKTRTERCGACPQCGGRDRFFVNADYWGCRGCHEQPGDAIELVRWFERCDFITALEKLSGENLREADEDDRTTKRTQVRRDDRADVWKSAIWQRAAALMNMTAATLDGPAGAPGRAYLEQRGITQHTWRCWLLGYAANSPYPSRRGGAAITIPYIHWDERLFAVRYRRIAPPTPNERYLNEPDSFCVLHGLHLLDENTHTLVIVEGELNAISIWQDARDLGLAVVSIGSQYLKKVTFDALTYLSQRYARCIVWCDDPRRTLRVREAVRSPQLVLLKSPAPDGDKIDANDLLQRGLLRAFVERKLEKEVM